MRITQKEWTEIGKCNYAAKWLRPFCSYKLIKDDDKTFTRTQSLSWPIYILIFIPVHLLQAIILLWDGGLKEFMILKRYIGCDLLSKGSNAFDRAEQIWDRRNKSKNES